MISGMVTLAATGFAMLIGGAAYNAIKHGRAMSHEEIEAMASSGKKGPSVTRIHGIAVGRSFEIELSLTMVFIVLLERGAGKCHKFNSSGNGQCAAARASKHALALPTRWII
jgi:hypothetical protein